MKSVFAGAAVLAALVPVAAAAQGGDVVVQQRDAGTLGADGFARAVAKSTGLSVDLPCTYVELSFTDSKNESGSAQYANAGTIILCTRFEERQTFGIVLRTGYNNGAKGADHFFAQQIADDRKVGTVEEKSFKGNRAFTSLINDGTACKWKIGVRKGDELVTVSYITPVSKCETDKAAAMRVLNSLELR